MNGSSSDATELPAKGAPHAAGADGRARAPQPGHSGDLAEALQLIGAEVELDGSGRVQNGLRA